MNESKSLMNLAYLPFAVFVVMSFQAYSEADDFDPWTQTARYELEHRIDLGEWASAKSGSVRLWLPMPADNEHQRVLSKVIESPWDYLETQDASGNRFVYIELSGGDRNDSEIVMRFVVERLPHTGIVKSAAHPNTSLDPRRYVRGLSRIPLAGKVREYAEKAGMGYTTDGKRIRAYYDFVTKMMRYSKDGRGWGRGDAAWACESRYGNCTDFHSVIIGMCRSQGVAARFVMGFSIPTDKADAQIKGYHCWLEAFDPSFGWRPMDASEAWKMKRFDAYYGRLPSDRVEYTVGRDLVLEPPQKGEPLNFFIYPYAEVSGKPAGSVPWALRARRIGSHDW